MSQAGGESGRVANGKGRLLKAAPPSGPRDWAVL